MQLGVFVLIALVPILEIVLLVKLGQWLGVWPTVLVVLATAVLGTFVLRRQGFRVATRVMESIAAGKPPVGPAVDGAFLMAAGLLLIAPGVITDAVGLLLLIPQLRHAVAAWSVRRILRSSVIRSTTFTRATFRTTTERGAWPADRDGRNGSAPGDGPVIDGEFERIDERPIETRRPSQGPSQRSGLNGSGLNGSGHSGDRV